MSLQTTEPEKKDAGAAPAGWERFAGDRYFRWLGAALIAGAALPVFFWSVQKAFTPAVGPIAWLAALPALAGCVLAVLVALGQRQAYAAAMYVAAFPVAFAFRVWTRPGGAGSPALAGLAAAYAVLTLAVLTLGKPPAPAPAAGRARREEERRGSGDPIEWSRDNVEAIVVAFLMALIIRCFCVEVFKIPTGSMEPTLYGDTKPTDAPPHHQGDRIMVDKVGLMFEPVYRYDVCVFKYPLDRSRNFIKRIVGLPGEDFKIAHGDLWTRPHAGGDGRFRIARKPAREQPGIWIPVWPGNDRTRAWARKKWDGAAEGCYLDGNRFDSAPAGGNATFRFHQIVDGNYKGLGSSSRVHDLRVTFQATFAQGKGSVFVRHARADGFGTFVATVEAGGKVAVEHIPDVNGTFVPAGAPPSAQVEPIAPGSEIEVANFDGALRVRIDAREVLVWEYVTEFPDQLRAADPPQFQVTFGSKDGPVTFENLAVGRDIFYYERGDNVMAGRDWLEIPEGKYLAIGDNVGNSKDGRLWRERVLKLRDGRTFSGDFDSPEHYPNPVAQGPDGRWRFRDLDGVDHWFTEAEVEDDGQSDPVWHPFVSREELVGKALVVWWPMDRFKVIR